jgi:tetrachlorobenzoquinone reductase
MPLSGLQGSIDVRLTAIRFAAVETNLYELSRPDGAALPAAEAGAHIGLHLPNGLFRQYSLLDASPNPASYTVGIKRDANGRGGSRYIHEQLRVGAALRIDAPRNNFPLVEDSRHTVLIAGGIGITPIWCMARRLQALGRDWTLHYACRSRPAAAFVEPLQALGRVRFHFDAEAGAPLDLAPIIAAAPRDAHLYCCGPAPMLAGFEAGTASWPRGQIHVEYFSPKQTPAATAERAFALRLARSGRTLEVPADRSILEVLREAGIDAPSACEEGICGACESRVLSGTPDHRDSILSDELRAANDIMMICCSRSAGETLELDL